MNNVRGASLSFIYTEEAEKYMSGHVGSRSYDFEMLAQSSDLHVPSREFEYVIFRN